MKQEYLTKRYRPSLDLLIIFAVAAIVSVLSIRFDLFEYWYEYTRSYEDWELDELTCIVFSVLVARTILSIIKYQKLKQTQEALQKSHKHLIQKSLTLEEYAYIAAHDLKEPVRLIHLSADIIKEDHQKSLSNTALVEIDNIQKQSRHLSQMITDLMRFANGNQSARSDIEPQNTYVILQEIISDIRKNKEYEKHHIHIKDKLPCVMGTKEKIDCIFRHLILNGLIHNKQAVKKIEIGLAERQPSETNRVTFYVKDNGLGIKQEHESLIFKLFKKLHPKTPENHGNGVGLALVLESLQKLNGRIWLESKEKQGTTFFFTLNKASEK